MLTFIAIALTHLIAFGCGVFFSAKIKAKLSSFGG